MKALLLSALLAGVVASPCVFAAAPAGAPAGTMGTCNDGTYSSSAQKKGACKGHKGVKEWYGDDAAAAAPPAGTHPTTTATAAPAATPAAATTTTTKVAATPPAAAHTSGTTTAPAPGGGPGKVWANTSTKVYHCSGDKYYGTTKAGEYMSESDAKAKGYHADHGKACS
jgi:hypothetical protein